MDYAKIKDQIVAVTFHEMSHTKLSNNQGYVFEDRAIEFEHMGETKGTHYMTTDTYLKEYETQMRFSKQSSVSDIWKTVEQQLDESFSFAYSISDIDVTRGTVIEITQIETLIQRLVSMQYIESISGVTYPWTYMASPGAPFAFHSEDSLLPSFNIHLFGESKIWCIIFPEHKTRLETLVANHHKMKKQNKRGQIIRDKGDPFCRSYLRHKTTFIPLWMLKKWKIRFTIVEQRQGDIIITMPDGMHGGINTGFNCNVSMNVASKSWISYGLQAESVSNKTISVISYQFSKMHFIISQLPSIFFLDVYPISHLALLFFYNCGHALRVSPLQS